MRLRQLLLNVEKSGRSSSQGKNVVAFSGGVDSSVVAAAVYRVFPENSLCVIGRSAALPFEQLAVARRVAKDIGITLKEVHTKEGKNETYIENKGMSCYSCKTHLYTALKDIKSYVTDSGRDHSLVTLFNGTNKDDTQDQTRVGLIAAKEFDVASVLVDFTKDEVRSLAKELNLFNHNYAASPCLRSRLAFGVEATSDNLARIEKAESIVKQTLSSHQGPSLFLPHHNLRVRQLKKNCARIELDKSVLADFADLLPDVAQNLSHLGFETVDFKAFRSGGIATVIPLSY